MVPRSAGRVALSVGVSVSLLFAPMIVGAQAPAAAPESDVAKVVRYTRALETSPDRADAREIRRWLLEWAEDTPDYTINVCDVLDHASWGDANSSHGAELLVQTMYGNAAFQVEGGAKADELSKQVAGVESTLRAYSALVAKDPRASVLHLDDLIAKRDASKLRDYLRPIVEKRCSGITGAIAKPDSRIDASAPPAALFLGEFLRESHVLYPLKLDGWEMQGERRFDTQQAGALVRFQRSGDVSGWIDVFFYPIGVLTDEQVANRASAERQALLEAWGESMAGPLDMSALKTFVVQVDSESKSGKAIKEDGITAYTLDFAYAHDGKPRSSAMVFTVDRMYAIKFRYSAQASEFTRARVRGELEQFAQHMLRRVEISSSGGCWSTSPAAHFEGCTGAEPFQPEVKDGMRELRFEYRASESNPVERPLRAKRFGTG